MQPTPPTRDAPPHMPEVAQPWTHSSGPVGTTPLLVCPQSRREGCSPHSLPGGPWSESGIPHQRRTSLAKNVFFIAENPVSTTPQALDQTLFIRIHLLCSRSQKGPTPQASHKSRHQPRMSHQGDNRGMSALQGKHCKRS